MGIWVGLSLEFFYGMQALCNAGEFRHQSRNNRRTGGTWLGNTGKICLRGCLLLNRGRRWWLVLLVDHVEQLGLSGLDLLEVLG